MVAALEDGQDAAARGGTGESGDLARDGGEVLGLEQPVAQRVEAMPVEPGGDEDKIGREALAHLVQDVAHLGDDLPRRRGGGKGTVERRARALAGAGLVRPSGAGVVAGLVDGDEDDAGVGLEDRLGPVAVVDVEVDDDRPPGETFSASFSRQKSRARGVSPATSTMQASGSGKPER